MKLPGDYTERVYAGILGKIIGVYLGRPVEGWTYEKITSRFGEITRYVNEELGLPLVVTDDDIAGTFTFLRALPDYGNSKALSSEQIGQTWLNYLVENQAILWWGGMGCSTEHTAYLRLKNGIPAPRSGSMAKKPMSACSPRTASTEACAFSNTTSSQPTPKRSAKARARSIDTPAGSPAALRPARMGLPRLMEARSTPVGVKAWTISVGSGVDMVRNDAKPMKTTSLRCPHVHRRRCKWDNGPHLRRQ